MEVNLSGRIEGQLFCGEPDASFCAARATTTSLKNLQQEYLQIAASLQRTQTSEAARMDVFSAQLQPILDQFPQVLSSLTHLEGLVGNQQNFLQINHTEDQPNTSVIIPACELL